MLADESLPGTVLELASFPTRFLALEFNDPTCDPFNPPFFCPPLVVTASDDASSGDVVVNDVTIPASFFEKAAAARARLGG